MIAATSIYSSAPENIVESPTGRFRFAPGKRTIRLPLIDRSTGLRARVTYAALALAAARLGGRMPTAAEEEQLAKVAFFIRPTVVRETPEEATARVKAGLGVEHSLDRMASIEWAARCDDDAIAQLEAWDGDRPVLNWGKQWVSEDLAGHAPGPAQAFNEGWDDDPNPNRTHWIQTVGGVHNRLHVDYSQIGWIVFDEDLPSDPPARPREVYLTDEGVSLSIFDGISSVIGNAENALSSFWSDVAANVHRLPITAAKPVAAIAARPPGIALSMVAWPAELPCITRVVPSPHFRAYGSANGKRREVDNFVIHTAECSRTSTAAEGLGAFFAAPATKVSSHAEADNDSIVQSVRLDDIAWAAPPLNDRGIHLELAGRAAQTAADWADAYGTAQLALAARFCRESCDRYGIPLELVDAAGLRAGRRGITTHKCVSDGFHQSDHQDPGAAFPLDHFLDLVRAAS